MKKEEILEFIDAITYAVEQESKNSCGQYGQDLSDDYRMLTRWRDSVDTFYKENDIVVQDTTEPMLTVSEVAYLIAEVVGDKCACNMNGNDEWLSERCQYESTSCPNPGGNKCWEEYVRQKVKNLK